jgi:Transposase DDE domain
MPSITLEELLTILYVLVDDWYRAEGWHYLKGKAGAKPVFRDSEVITLVLTRDFLPFPSEGQFLAFVRSNYLSLFPRLLERSQFNRRARGLRLLIEQFRRFWLRRAGLGNCTCFLLDTKPVPVVGVKRSNRHSDFAPTAAYGRCASRKMTYFGYKLVALTTLAGLPVFYELVPANATEHQAAETLLDGIRGGDVLGDKGFISAPWQAEIYQQTGNRIWTPKRANQHQQNPKEFEHLLKHDRMRIEGVFHELTDTGCNLERLHARTLLGLCTRVIAKLTSHTLRVFLRLFFGINLQSFSLSAIPH